MCKPDEIIGSTIKNDPILKQARDAQKLLNTMVADRITEIRNSCEHDHQKDLDKKRNLTSKTCTKCGDIKKKPKGQPWEVCTKCWGEMKYMGKTPGQGGDGWHIHECKKCGHEDSHN